MRDAKSALLDAIRVPDGFDPEWFARVVPELPDLPPATDADTAGVAIAAFCGNQNKIMKLFEGVPLLKYLWHGCQLSSPLIGLLLASLEQFDVKVGEVKLITPVDGGQYFGSVSYYVVSISEGTPESVIATLDDQEFPMVANGDFWTASFTTPTGPHHISVVADFGGGVTKSVSGAFDLKSWEEAISVPEPEQRLEKIASIQLQTGSNKDVTSIRFVGGGYVDVELSDDGGGRWVDRNLKLSGIADLPKGDYVGDFNIQTSNGLFTKSVFFSILGDAHEQ